MQERSITELRHISPLWLGFFGGVFGLTSALAYYATVFCAQAVMDVTDIPLLKQDVNLAVLFWGSAAFAVAGVVQGGLIALIYNVAARIVGGLRLELAQTDRPSAPSSKTESSPEQSDKPGE
ncbi:hypothetical protein ACFL59_08180 [Planctomycetota bacterium]